MNENINNPDYKKITPFKGWVIENFPFIEADFDAITNYQLISKVVEYLNQVIANENLTEQQIETLTTAYNNLESYVNNYFDTLDVQEEVNTKIDAMVEDGTLDEIINQELLGQINTNIGDLDDLKTGDKSSLVNAINNVITRKYVLIGDSYLGGYNGSTTVNSWGYYFKTYNNISNDDFYSFYESGAGFYREGSAHNYNFKKIIENNLSNISDPNQITDVIICGGVNDHSYDISTITNAMSTCISYAKSVFPNATVYVGCISAKSGVSDYNTRQQINERVLQVYKSCGKYGAKYLTNIELISRDYSMYGVDDTHMIEDGYRAIGAALMNAMDSGYSYIQVQRRVEFTPIFAGTVKKIYMNERYVNNIKSLNIEDFNLNDITSFSQSGTELIITPENSITNLNYIRNTYNYTPSIPASLYITFSDSQYDGYYPGVFRWNNNGQLVFDTSSVINGKTITAIRLWTRPFATADALLW